jgi:hypothetical protein
MAKPEDLLGTWTMLSWQKQTVATGQTADAHGLNPIGYITYCPDGRMHAIVVRRDRATPQKLPPTDAEKLRLFDSMLAYAGTYSLEEDKVVHHVDTSWNQAWTNTDLIRFYELENGLLTITGAPAADPYSGQEVVHRMDFRKV